MINLCHPNLAEMSPLMVNSTDNLYTTTYCEREGGGYNEVVNNEMSQSINVRSNKYTKTIASVVAITAVIIFAAVLAVILKKGPTNQPQSSVSPDAQTQMQNQALASLKGAVPATQAETQAALKQLSVSKVQPASQRQIDQALSQLKVQ
jgi:multisubunit Na+/H+ antiporter MnhC subunit